MGDNTRAMIAYISLKITVSYIYKQIYPIHFDLKTYVYDIEGMI